ncbi:Alpha/beta hydrolase [Candidatus Hodgkinia cicadicola]|uniref:Alpha/beta hydrolase n=1 Tax=Candidatus Hodgkinia cicadicola TaxID=573658 RepID=A0ABX4MF73_9HYPH|nr:Alpha/beta hydrolase [Candidatus Hodgkinia cicadicola]
MVLDLRVFEESCLSSWSLGNKHSQIVYVINSEFDNIKSVYLLDEIVTLLNDLKLNVISQNINSTRINNPIFYKDNLIKVELTLNWLLERNKHRHGIIVIGVSFGSCLAAELVMRRPEISEYILISPPIRYYDFRLLARLGVPGTMVIAKGDKFAALSNLYKVYNSTKINLMCKLKLIIVRNTDHLFNGRYDALNRIIIDVYNKHKISNMYRDSIKL